MIHFASKSTKNWWSDNATNINGISQY